MKPRCANRPQRRRSLVFCGLLLALASVDLHAASFKSDALTHTDATGSVRTFTPSGTIDRNNPFFQDLGSNGRSCDSCHRPENAWSISPTDLQMRFVRTSGIDPVFRIVDGANSPHANVSTVAAKRNAYNMLLGKGLIRVGMGIPANAEFTLDSVDDPYHYASAAELSLFRRPLPAANLRFVTGAMWDARETHAPFLPPMDAGINSDDLVQSFKSQAFDAVLGHAQAVSAPTPEQVQQIVDFEMSLTTAQVFDRFAGYLNTDDALGGPRALAAQQFYVGVNDVLGADPAGTTFDPVAMRLFAAWDGDSNAQRAAIARGEKLFGTKSFAITGVGGLNDALGLPSIAGTCTTCHDAPNVGNHSVALPIDIGLTDASRRTPDMPLYTLRNKTTNETRQTTDPGRAMISGKWADIGKFKGPILRGLAARPPYFHNGSARTLADAVDFYDTRFNIALTAQEKADLTAFLSAL
jgi:cytochrome c peroxidase